MDFSERHIISHDWATYLLVLCFVIFALTKYLYPRRFYEFLLLPITNKYFFVQGKDDSLGHPFNLFLFVTQIISVSLFIFFIFKVFNPSEIQKNPWFFLQISTVFTVFVLMKISLEKIVANVFSLDEMMNNYLYQKLSYRNFLGILLFTGNLFFLYVVPPTAVSLIVFGIFILVLNAISLLYSYKKMGNLILDNFFYFILYLCTLEIAPYIILYKTFF